MSKRVLVTGGTGFVGANLVRRLLADGYETHLLLRPPHQTWRLRDVGAHIGQHHAHLENGAAVRAIVHSVKPEWVFHLAAYGAYSTQQGMAEMISTNLSGTVELLDACVREGAESFVQTGSSSEYGFRDRPTSECDALDPNSHYAITKAAASHYCRHVARTHGVHAVVLRLYSVYGPWEEPLRFVPTLVANALRGTLPKLVSPATARDFVWVDDAVSAMLIAAARPELPRGTILNVCSGSQTTIAEAVAIARDVFSVKAEPVWGSMEGRAWDTSTWVGNPELIRQELGWTARTRLGDGLRATSEWLLAHPELHGLYERQVGLA